MEGLWVSALSPVQELPLPSPLAAQAGGWTVLGQGTRARGALGRRASEVVIDIPDVAAECVGCPLQRPGEQGQLAPEVTLLEAGTRRHPGGGGPGGPGAIGAQQPQVVEQGIQRVLSTTQEDVAERGIGRRHVLGQ